ncbi:phosphopentomutase [Thaumasiovibrio sp. DFM-14]|uniref:phosphopentomutase n=1 Tax=Thaumasiovibrio sp. DFM-14 TaxID=3384792 RepID=UPI0039A0E391
MAKFIVVVLDGFGVGAMEDVAHVRPQDCGANTAAKLLRHFPLKHLPTLALLGLQNLVVSQESAMKANLLANVGKANLAHQGGDTFMGHQEIMGTCPKPPVIEPFQHVLGDVEKALTKQGYRVSKISRQGLDVLAVNDGVVIGDNLEADLGQVYNLTCNFNQVSYQELMKIADVVRGVTKVSRNIAFGGEIDSMERVYSAIEVKSDRSGNPAFIGVNAPNSGAYDCGFRVMHLGFGVDASTQVPWLLHQKGIGTWLYGKVADIVQNPKGCSYTSIVDTDEIFNLLCHDVSVEQDGFFCANVQETDLAGHQQDPKRYWQILEKADNGLERLIAQLGEEDVLLVMADHGNDPFIGHTKHTREQVPLLAYKKGHVGLDLGVSETLADVGATVAFFFGATAPEFGKPISALIES